MRERIRGLGEVHPAFAVSQSQDLRKPFAVDVRAESSIPDPRILVHSATRSVEAFTPGSHLTIQGIELCVVLAFRSLPRGPCTVFEGRSPMEAYLECSVWHRPCSGAASRGQPKGSKRSLELRRGPSVAHWLPKQATVQPASLTALAILVALRSALWVSRVAPVGSRCGMSLWVTDIHERLSSECM